MFLRNCWYVAGFSDELDRKLLARTLVNEQILLYRTSDGRPVALEDRCAHRRLPLSNGTLMGDQVQCAYHGLVYDCTGKCTLIPGRDAIPGDARVRSYPVVDRHGFAWIWMGDPSLADASKIPDYSPIDDPRLGKTRLHLNLQCNYQLHIDNLLDLSHIAFVHGTRTGNTEVGHKTTVRVERTDNKVAVIRHQVDIDPPGTFARFGGYNGRVDMWQITEFTPPSYVRLSYGSGPAGIGVPESEEIWSQGRWGFQVFQGITPETEVSGHQFRYITFDPGLGDVAAVQRFCREMDDISYEDVPILAAQQQALLSDPEFTAWDLRPKIATDSDTGPAHARRIVKSLVKQEQQQRELVAG